MITDFAQLDLTKQYTYADYLTWQIKDRIELIEGFISGKPSGESPRHQEVIGALMFALHNLWQKEKWEYYFLRFNVRLDAKNSQTNNKEIFTVVQPDYLVQTNFECIDEQGIIGCPALVVEAIAKGRIKHDLETKYHLYEKYGVKEYWIINTYDEYITIYDLINGQYEKRDDYDTGTRISGGILGDFELEVEKVFAEQL
jgi:Uma2 family endonuclease